MIKLLTSDLREFIRNARAVKPNNTLAILGYIRMSCDGGIATLSKTNLQAAVTQSFDASHNGEPVLLLDEKIVSNICANTNAQELTIEVRGDDIIISDGKTQLSFQNESPANYPTAHEWNEENPCVTLSTAVLSAISIASKHTALNDGKVLSAFSFVHLHKRGDAYDVFASAIATMYLRVFGDELPEISLLPEACAAICAFPQVRHQAHGNVDVFHTGEAVYGFTRMELGRPNYEGFLKGIKREGGFIITKAALLRFCDLTIGASPSPVPFIVLSDAGANLIRLQFEDKNFRVSTSEEIEVEKDGEIKPFTFNARILQPALKALPYDVLHLYQVNDGTYGIAASDDDAYTGLLMGVVPAASK